MYAQEEAYLDPLLLFCDLCWANEGIFADGSTNGCFGGAGFNGAHSKESPLQGLKVW